MPVEQVNISANGGEALKETNGAPAIGFEILGTWVGTLAFQARISGGSWQAINAALRPSTLFGSSTTANGIYLMPADGWDEVRITATAWTSGTANVFFASSIAGVGGPQTYIAGGGLTDAAGAAIFRVQSDADNAPQLINRLATRADLWGYDAAGDNWDRIKATAGVLQVSTTPASGSPATPVSIADGSDVAEGARADAAATTDAGTFSLIALVKRLLQKWTTQLPAALVSGRLDVNIGASPATVPVSAAALPLPAGAATETTLSTRLSEGDFDSKAGSLTEAAPGTDTASSGLNGRLQRIAQRLTSLIALLPTALVGGRLDVNVGAGTVSTTPTQGTLTDRSGTITLGGTAQTLAAASATRKYLLIENLDLTNPLWINFTTAAVQSQPSIRLGVGGSFSMEAGFISTELVSVIAATTGHAWAAKES